MTELSISRDENVNCMTTLKPEIALQIKESVLCLVLTVDVFQENINCLFIFSCVHSMVSPTKQTAGLSNFRYRYEPPGLKCTKYHY